MNTSPGSETSEEGEPLLGTRRQARELALSLLYEADTKEVAPGVVLADFPIDPDPFAADLVGGVDAHQSEIDDLIRRFAKDWTIERMPVVDRNLLRIGVYELLQRPDVPTPAVISEAVELARRYSTEESGRFVNGMLARIAEEVRPEALAD
ncbi:MAG: transcription antitermination factor NusB [Acidimicrobiia bacterium]|nr:transcription antitermination factor NusB [Acidimicrobiia bacterium]